MVKRVPIVRYIDNFLVRRSLNDTGVLPLIEAAYAINNSAGAISPTYGELWQLFQVTPGLVFCPPSDQGEVIAALAISFSVWQCAGHGDAAGLGFVH